MIHGGEEDSLLTITEVADQLKIHRATLHRWVKAGDFPRPIKINGYHNRYRATEVRDWVDAKFTAGRDADL